MQLSTEIQLCNIEIFALNNKTTRIKLLRKYFKYKVPHEMIKIHFQRLFRICHQLQEYQELLTQTTYFQKLFSYSKVHSERFDLKIIYLRVNKEDDKNKICKVSHFVIQRVISSVLSNGYTPFFFIPPSIREKMPFFCLYLFAQAWVILGFLFLETILRHLCLSYIHPTLCAFFSIYFSYLLLLNMRLLELSY